MSLGDGCACIMEIVFSRLFLLLNFLSCVNGKNHKVICHL